MTALNQNIGGDDDPFIAGDTKAIRVHVKDKLGADFPLPPGTDIRWALTRKLGETVPILIKESPSGIEVTDQVGGVFEIELLGPDTETLTAPYTYWHEAEIVLAGEIMTVLQGTFTIRPRSLKPAA